MRVLVACESSGKVRDAFRAIGHDAWSCDLLPCDADPTFHIQGDAIQAAAEGWGLMIAHPPCTYLTLSGNRWFSDSAKAAPGILTGEARRKARKDAKEFVNALASFVIDGTIEKIAIENPIGRLSTMWMKPDQIIQPWMFGHGEVKATCLWLFNLPKLVPTNIVEGREPRVHHMPPTADRWKMRSETLPGIAAAMASQWGQHDL